MGFVCSHVGPTRGADKGEMVGGYSVRFWRCYPCLGRSPIRVELLQSGLVYQGFIWGDFGLYKACKLGHIYMFFERYHIHPNLISQSRKKTPLVDHQGSLLLLKNISRGGRKRPLVSTRSGSTHQKHLRFIVQDLLLSSFDLCSTNKDRIFLCERSHRPSQQGLQGKKTTNPNLY